LYGWVLQQNAYHDVDTFVPLEKQMGMLDVMLTLYDEGKSLVERSIPLSQLSATGLFDRLIRMKYDLPNDRPEKIAEFKKDILDCVARVFAEQHMDQHGES